jgi:hypothetical protein
MAVGSPEGLGIGVGCWQVENAGHGLFFLSISSI